MNLFSASSPTPVHFAGVHRHNPKKPKYQSSVGREYFKYKGQEYYTTDKEALQLRDAILTDSGPNLPGQEDMLDKTKMKLVKKEVNYQCQHAIANKNLSALLVLLQHPDVELSRKDDRKEISLPARLIGNNANFKALAKLTGSREQARLLVKKVMAAQIEPDLDFGFGTGAYLEHPVTDSRATAWSIAKDAFNQFFEHLHADRHKKLSREYSPSPFRLKN